MDKKVIMVVDDEPHIVEMMETYLDIKGYAVRGAYSGQSGLVLVQADKPDALLLDLMMPDIEGYEVCAQLRQMPEFAALPIVIISARTDPASKRRAEDAGADAFFTKPVNMVQLVSTLEKLFAERAAAPPAAPASPAQAETAPSAPASPAATTPSVPTASAPPTQPSPAVPAPESSTTPAPPTSAASSDAPTNPSKPDGWPPEK
jgi:DNA-binding response OmpR family regulator